MGEVERDRFNGLRTRHLHCPQDPAGQVERGGERREGRDSWILEDPKRQEEATFSDQMKGCAAAVERAQIDDNTG